MKKAIGMLVMLMGLTANAQSINAQVDTLKDGTITIEFDNTLYVIDKENNELAQYTISKDKKRGMLSQMYTLSRRELPQSTCSKNKK